MADAALFYLACTVVGILLCFPFGAASLEMLRLSLAGKRRAALYVALGAGLACGTWATLSFLGVRSIMHLMEIPWVEVVLLGAAAVLIGWFAVLAWHDSRRLHLDVPHIQTKGGSRRPFAQVGKGVLLGLLNPQTIASWVVILSLLKKAGVKVPEAESAWLLFFLAVAAGYETFFLSVIHLARRLKFLRAARSRAQLQKAVAGLLAVMALLCLAAALKVAFG